MKYVLFDTDGLPVAFYDSLIHADNIPASAVQITDLQWQEFLTNQGSRCWDGSKVVEYVYQPTIDELAARIRSERDALIAETDYLVMPDYPLSAEQLAAVKAYRQSLRDITSQDTFPQSVVWPVEPDM